MYSNLYRWTRLFYPGGMLKNQRLRELEKTQWLSPSELETWQFKKIQQLVKYAYEHVPYYHHKYQNLDIHPEDIKSFKDFQALPFLTREDINNNLESLVSPELRSIALPNSTGGSTGQPMRFFREKAFSYWDNALELRGRGWYGVYEGDKVAWVWGAKQDIHNWNWTSRFKAKILQERYLNAFNMTDQNMQAFAEMLIGWKPAMFRAYASALTVLAHYIRDHHITGIQPKLIETTAEKVTLSQRELLEEIFNCKVVDWYSSREFGTIAFQCPVGSLHVCETRYLEIIANSKVVQPSELGEVAITSLHQYAMPFIRYKIGDMAISEPDRCACGRGLPTLREVVGRLHDFLVTSDGHFVHGEFFSHTLRGSPEVSQYQVYQPDTKHIEVRLLCRSKVDLIWLENLRKEIQHRFGEGMQIELKLVDHFELTRAGKHRFIISDVKPDFVN